MNRKTFLLLLFPVLLITCNNPDEREEPDTSVRIDSMPPTEVEIAVVEKRPFNRQIVSNGKLRALKKPSCGLRSMRGSGVFTWRMVSMLKREQRSPN